MSTRSRKRCRGSSLIEISFLLPWFIFLFVGAFDWGFYSHALISTESAARVAALYTSQSEATTASNATNDAAVCKYARGELSISANISATQPCTALPLIVTYTGTTGADGERASEVTVTYQSLRLIPIPGLLSGQPTFRRTVQMRLRG